MGGRIALVVGSECAAFGELGFTGELAVNLSTALSEHGGWHPIPGLDATVTNPTAAELSEVLDLAFRAATEQQATLLFGFIGHGLATGAEDFYLLCHDSPPVPHSRNAFHLTQGIRERLAVHHPDGLIVLVDACETEQAVFGAARRWSELLAHSAGRMELLVASGDGPAYAGCFTRTLLGTFAAGLPERGENLLPADMVDPLTEACVRQQAHHLSFTAGSPSPHDGDPGLWLVPNVARRRDAVTGRPSASLVDELTRGVLVTATVREVLAAVVDAGGHRLRVLVGPAGAGKSTLLAMLIRPGLVDFLPVSADYITAAVFLNVASSVTTVAAELSAQLAARLPDFAATREYGRVRAARGATVDDVFAVEVAQPLARVTAGGRRVTLVVDGLNEPEPGTRDLLIGLIAELTLDPVFRHVRVVAGIRAGTGVELEAALAHMHVVPVAEPVAADLAAIVDAGTDSGLPDPARVAWIDRLREHTPGAIAGDARAGAGGWLLARLLSEVASADDRPGLDTDGLDGVIATRVRAAVRTARSAQAPAIAGLLAVLVAAGVGPVLPVELLDAALRRSSIVLGIARIRDVAVGLGALVTRAGPGTAEETLGIPHGALLPGLTAECARLGARVEDAHRALVEAIEADTGERAVAYARGAAVRHYLECGDPATAFEFLESQRTRRDADNRDLWSSWLPTFVAELGPDHRASLRVRNRLADCRGRCGDIETAMRDLQALAADQTRVLGAEDRDTLGTRVDLAEWHGGSGQSARAVTELEHLVDDYTRVLGADDRRTLRVRAGLGYWRGERGSLRRAIADLEQLIADQSRILGGDDHESLLARHHLARCRAMSGEIQRALAEFADLLADQRRVLGADHEQTVRTRVNIARWQHENGELGAAVRSYGALHADQLRLLGPDHPDTLYIRLCLAQCHGEAGAVDRAVHELETLRTDLLRVLGPHHAHSVLTATALAFWTARKAG